MIFKTKYIEQAISDATKPNLTLTEYKRLKKFLLSCQSHFIPPITLISIVETALAAPKHRIPIFLSRYQKPADLIFIGACGDVLAYATLLLLGWVNYHMYNKIFYCTKYQRQKLKIFNFKKYLSINLSM